MTYPSLVPSETTAPRPQPRIRPLYVVPRALPLVLAMALALALALALLLGLWLVLQGEAAASGAGSTAQNDPAAPQPAPTAPPLGHPRPVPTGFVEMHVFVVAPTEMGNVVILADAAESRMVPIWIGETEALAISLRLDGNGFRRPLTHDLVDAILRELDASLVEVRIDSLEASTFVASLFIRQGEREFLLDSRASDSIALALGSHIPIFVSERVVSEAGLQPWELGVPGTRPPGGTTSPTSQPNIPL
jgi:uncharacterized protein